MWKNSDFRQIQISVTRGHGNCHYLMATYHFLLVVTTSILQVAPFPIYYHIYSVL